MKSHSSHQHSPSRTAKMTAHYLSSQCIQHVLFHLVQQSHKQEYQDAICCEYTAVAVAESEAWIYLLQQ
jgi:hypothetical protein